MEFFFIVYLASLLVLKQFCHYKNSTIVCIVLVLAVVVEHGFNSRFDNLELSLFLGAAGFPPVVVCSKLRRLDRFYTKHIS